MDVATVIAIITTIIAIVGMVLGIASWLSTRDSKNDKDAEWKGTVNAKLDTLISLNADVSNAKNKLQDHETRICIIEKVIDTKE